MILMRNTLDLRVDLEVVVLVDLIIQFLVVDNLQNLVLILLAVVVVELEVV
tara:strand:- start:2 stop:154 length:153 start_codon:yes stop_codon:yes gene_type:complete